MDYTSFFFRVGIIGLIAFALVLVLGIVLLVTALAKRRADGSMKKGKLVAGIVLMVASFIFIFFFAFVAVMSAVAKGTYNDEKLVSASDDIAEAFEEGDPDKICDMLAEEGVDGKAPSEKDVREMFSMIEGDVEDEIEYTFTAYHSNNDIKIVTIKFGPFETDEGEEYTLRVDYVVRASDDDTVGIQYIALEDDDSKLIDSGKKYVAPQPTYSGPKYGRHI